MSRATPIPQADQADAFDFYWKSMAALYRPEPEREYVFAPDRKWRFDFAWPPFKVAVEIDGGQHKAGGGRHGGDADREKMNRAAEQGWRVLHFSTEMLERDPAGCIEQVYRTLYPTIMEYQPVPPAARVNCKHEKVAFGDRFCPDCHAPIRWETEQR